MLEQGARFAGRFTVERMIATGGMGSVYEVSGGHGKRRALKVLLSHLSKDEKVRERFAFEATVAQRIESDHIVEVFETGEEAGTPWLLMELLTGETLEDRVSRGRLTLGETAALFEQLGHGLGAAHRAGVLHMDLKPANLFLAQPRLSGAPMVLKILDFGIARLVEAGKTSAELTTAGGTLAWEAPEQTDVGEKVHPSIDVWPLGLIAFYALTGREYWRVQNLPQSQYNAKALLKEILFEAVIPASERARSIDPTLTLPHGFDAWFARCLQREPADRYQNAEEAIAPLLALLPRASLPSPMSSASIPSVPPSTPVISRTELATPPRLAPTEMPPPMPVTELSRPPVTEPLTTPAPSRAPLYATAGVAALLLVTVGGWKLMNATPTEPTSASISAPQPTPAPAVLPSEVTSAQTPAPTEAPTEAPADVPVAAPVAAPANAATPGIPPEVMEQIRRQLQQRAQEAPAPVPARNTDRPAHVSTAVPAPVANTGESPMATARQCLRDNADNPVERNACVIRALAGRVSGCDQGLLATSYRDSGQTASAVRTMQRYIQQCPAGPFVASFQNYLSEHQR